MDSRAACPLGHIIAIHSICMHMSSWMVRGSKGAICDVHELGSCRIDNVAGTYGPHRGEQSDPVVWLLDATVQPG